MAKPDISSSKIFKFKYIILKNTYFFCKGFSTYLHNT